MTMADLSPDALAQLEAKLVADLEMVRKVRALLEEHRVGLGVGVPMVSATAPVPAAAVALAAVSSTPKMTRPMEEVLREGLMGLGERPFSPQDFKNAVKKATGSHPDDKGVKTFLSRMIRQGQVVVHEFRKGRPGCLYRSLIPPPAASEKPPQTPDDPAVSLGPPADSPAPPT